MTELKVEISDREREAVQAVLAEARAMFNLLAPIIAPFAADNRRQENWKIAMQVAERVKVASIPASGEDQK